MSRPHREYFNKCASEWNQLMIEEDSFRAHLLRFGVTDGDKVLDVGAGTGRMTRHLSELVGKRGWIVTEDIAENMLSEGRRLHQNLQNFYICDTVTALALKDNIFDKILCFSAFPHFTNHISALREMNRVLKPGGSLLILHTSSSKKLNEFHASLDYPVCRDKLPKAEAMVPLLKQTGFSPKVIDENENLYWIEAIKK